MKEFFNIEEEVIFGKLMPDGFQQQDNSSEPLIIADLSGCKTIMDVNKITRDITELGKLIETMKETSENYAFRPLISDQKVIGKGIIFFKKTIRKLLKWYIEPICFQQTAFNQAVTHSITRLAEIQSELIVSVAELAGQAELEEKNPTGDEAAGALEGSRAKAQKNSLNG